MSDFLTPQALTLQWGRDQLIAEFPFAGRPCFVLLHASNGAAIN